MSEKETILVWLWVGITVSVISLSVAFWAVSTADKDNDTTHVRRIQACTDSGASYIGGQCIQVRCAP